MIEKLMVYLRYEEQILQEVVDLAREQQQALISMNLSQLDNISLQQEEALSNLRRAEEARINFISDWLNITKTSASKMTMTQLLDFSDESNYSVLSLMQDSMSDLAKQLYNLNLSNRILSNKAKNSVSELMEILTNGTNNAYNVRV